MLKKIFIIVFLVVVSLLVYQTTNYDRAYAAQVEEFDDYYTVTFPAGSYFSVILQQPIDSGIVKEDDLIEAVIPDNLYINTMMVIPKGTRAIGRIIYIERAHQGRDSLINIRFVSMVQPNKAWEVPINASIKDKNPDGSIGGGLTERTKVKIIAHNIERIGTYGQAVQTGPRAMGKELFIPPGERWVIVLNEPARFIISK